MELETYRVGTLLPALKAATNLGVSSIYGAGASVFAGLDIRAAGAPVLVVTLGATVVGVAAGAFFSWCTSSVTKAEEPEVCAVASVQSELTELPNGETGFAYTLPAGQGTLCMHIEGKAPVCFDTDIKNEGNTISIDCLANIDDPVTTKECNDGVLNENNLSILCD